MGELDVHRLDAGELRWFARALLRDVEALELMLADGAIQSGHRRVGCEQEMFLTDASGRPRATALEFLHALGDAHFTSELGLFNLEVNQDSLPFRGACLSDMESDLCRRLSQAAVIGREFETEIVLTGILPTLRKSDLTVANLTPLERYRSLNEVMKELGGGRYELRLQGADELILMQDSVMLEACCTSFQVHYQADPEEFVNLYNVAQAVTAPLLAAAANSPLLFGRRLWQETRIPLFQQSIDTRRARGSIRERSARVTFGEKWLTGSVVELFRDEIARLPIILGTRVEVDSVDMYRGGQLPALRALQVHNGTVYRWNRPCYGISNGVAHLRIENRVMSAGPTVRDSVANAAFFFGLLRALPGQVPDIASVMNFEHAKLNFLSAARSGLESQFCWIDGRSVSATHLILDDLLPVARQGLCDAGIESRDIDTYLGLIERRVSSGRTGAVWITNSFDAMRGERRETSLAALTSAMMEYQWTGSPVHEWPLASASKLRVGDGAMMRVEEAMSTDLLTVRPDEPVEMALSLMEWHGIRHIPVEDNHGRLKGMLSIRELRGRPGAAFEGDQDPLPVSRIMETRPSVIAPEQSLADAARQMLSDRVDYLVVVESGRVAGILTELDIRRVAPFLLDVDTSQG